MRKYYGPLLGHTASKITALYVIYVVMNVLCMRGKEIVLFCHATVLLRIFALYSICFSSGFEFLNYCQKIGCDA